MIYVVDEPRAWIISYTVILWLLQYMLYQNSRQKQYNDHNISKIHDGQ